MTSPSRITGAASHRTAAASAIGAAGRPLQELSRSGHLGNFPSAPLGSIHPASTQAGRHDWIAQQPVAEAGARHQRHQVRVARDPHGIRIAGHGDGDPPPEAKPPQGGTDRLARLPFPRCRDVAAGGVAFRRHLPGRQERMSRPDSGHGTGGGCGSPARRYRAGRSPGRSVPHGTGPHPCQASRQSGAERLAPTWNPPDLRLRQPEQLRHGSTFGCREITALSDRKVRFDRS